ncbi:toprim domain-containing protein [Candidatus Poriferisocius sp.]|uniref:toprim domain-containing protein n=1 Tax=Candidatus Poriferisocius sp. TaxID=3101276 RepID=UPI003B01B2B7
MSADGAKAHLAEIAADSRRALPAATGIDAAALVDRRDLAGQRARADDIDDHIADEIDDWLAGLCEFEGESAARQDQEMMEMEDRLLAHIDRLDAAVLSAAQPGVPALGERRPTLGAIRSARGLLDNGFRFINRQALDQIARHNQTAGALDNPWLIELWAMYQQADTHSRAQLTPLVVAVCDPPARQRIEALTGCEPPTGQAAVWAADVRAAVAARRKAQHRSVLDDLAAQRTARIAQACGADLAHLVDADTNRWQAAVDDWADSGCTPRHLATAWEQAAIDIAQDLFAAANEPGPAPSADLQLAGAATQPRVDTDADRADPPPPTSVPAVAAMAARPDPSPTLIPASAGDRAGPDAAAVREAADWYHQQLVSSPDAAEARAYLIGRGIGEDLWAQWQLGWAPDQWQALVDHLVRSGIGAEAGIAAGVLGRTRGRTWDFLRGRVVFPIRDAVGTPIALAGRTLKDDGPKYLNTPNTRLYNKSEALYGTDQAAPSVAATGEAVVVEGYTDVIAAHQAGIKNTVAACGTALGPGHLHTLRAQCSQPGLLTIAFDSDTAGTKAAHTIAELADGQGVHTRTVQLPDGCDPADLQPEDLRRTVRHSLPHPWSAIARIAELDRTRSYGELARAARAAVRQTAGDPTAAVLAAHHIAVAADLDLQQLIDSALPTPAEAALAAPAIDIGL